MHRKILLASCIFTVFLSGCYKSEKPKETLREIKTHSIKAIDINSASVDELEKLPHVGRKLAERIVEHRKVYGHFRRAEHLILVRGMSDAKFRKIKDFVTVVD